MQARLNQVYSVEVYQVVGIKNQHMSFILVQHLGYVSMWYEITLARVSWHLGDVSLVWTKGL